MQITAMCWGLAHAYRASLFNIIQCSQGKERENEPMGTAATPTLETGAATKPEAPAMLV